MCSAFIRYRCFIENVEYLGKLTKSMGALCTASREFFIFYILKVQFIFMLNVKLLSSCNRNSNERAKCNSELLSDKTTHVVVFWQSMPRFEYPLYIISLYTIPSRYTLQIVIREGTQTWLLHFPNPSWVTNTGYCNQLQTVLGNKTRSLMYIILSL